MKSAKDAMCMWRAADKHRNMIEIVPGDTWPAMMKVDFETATLWAYTNMRRSAQKLIRRMKR